MKIIGTILMMLVGFMFDSKIEVTQTNELSKRQTVAVVNGVTGIVYKVGEDTYMIECGERQLKLNTFNLPEKYKVDNTRIRFSGNIKLTQPLEDDCGQLFEVTDVEL